MTASKRKTPYRRTRGEIVQKLAEVEHRIAKGETIEKIAGDLGVSGATIYYWRREAKKANAVEKQTAARKARGHAGLIFHDGQLFGSDTRRVPDDSTVPAAEYNRLLEENLFLRGLISNAAVDKLVRDGMLGQRETSTPALDA